MSLQSELQSRIARRQTVITQLTDRRLTLLSNGEYSLAREFKEHVAEFTRDQVLDKKLMRAIPWADMYVMKGFQEVAL